jgi:hypothetical protein
MKKHFIVAFLIGFLAVFLTIQMHQKMGGWGDPAPTPVSEVLQLPFGMETQVTVYKSIHESKGGNVYTIDEKQKRLWMYILRPYWYGLWVAIVYLCIVFIIRHDQKYI